MSERTNFHAIENSGMADVIDENDLSEKTKDALVQERVIDEVAFHDVKKTVDDTTQVLSTMKEDIFEIVGGTEKKFETLTIREDDILETVPATGKDVIQFVKTDENISGSPSESENKIIKSFEKEKLWKEVCWEFEKKKLIEKESKTGIEKEAINKPFVHNAFPSKDFQNVQEDRNYSTSDNANQISLEKIVEKMSLSDLLNIYIEYQSSSFENITLLYSNIHVLNKYLNENSLIAQQCRDVLIDTNPTSDISSISKRELNTMNEFLMKNARIHIECLRSLCWSLDGVKSKLRLFKNLNATMNMKTDRFLDFIFTSGKKD